MRVLAADLECSPHAEDPVVGFFGREAFDGQQDGLGLFGDQVIGSVDGTKH